MTTNYVVAWGLGSIELGAALIVLIFVWAIIKDRKVSAKLFAFPAFLVSGGAVAIWVGGLISMLSTPIVSNTVPLHALQIASGVITGIVFVILFITIGDVNTGIRRAYPPSLQWVQLACLLAVSVFLYSTGVVLTMMM